MSVTISLPIRIQQHLESGWGDDLPRKAKEALAVEGYRSGLLSVGEVAEMLELSINEADGFLKERGVAGIESLDEIDADSATLEELLSR
jgi:predicted HTH domain antitoxin